MATLSNAQIGEVIYELLNAPDAGQARCLLGDYPWLVSTEVDSKLTQVIANKYQARDLASVAVFTACRGLLRRCRLAGKDSALANQPGWPLASQGPLIQLLDLTARGATWELIIRWAKIVLGDVELEFEPDLVGLIHYHLGSSYQDLADQGNNEALDLAISSFETAVHIWQGQDGWLGWGLLGRAQHNLGRLYWKRRHGKRSQDIETALAWLEEAQKTFAEESPERRDALTLIGDAYLHRIAGERLENIKRAITYYQQAHLLAVELAGRERHFAKKRVHERHLAGIEHNLAVAYRMRLHGDRANNYELARELAEHALQRIDRQRYPEDWARTAAELATIYNYREQGDRKTNLEQAIVYVLKALDVYGPESHRQQWTLAQLTLGNLYCDRLSGVRTENYQHAIGCFRNILDYCDRESDPLRWAETMNNLGTVYASLALHPSDANYHQAIDCYLQALEVRRPETLPAQALQTATNWGNLNFWFGRWDLANDAFQIGLKAGQALYQASSTEAGRRVELAETWQLVARAAYCWLRQGQPDQALLQLERGKARLLAEALALGDSDLNRLPGSQRSDVLGLRQLIRALEAQMRQPPDTPGRRDDRDLAAELGQARADLDRLVQAIRLEHPDFMSTGLDMSGILKQIPEDGALVAPLLTAQGSAAFVLPAGIHRVGMEHVLPLETFTDADLHTLLVGSQDCLGWLRAYAAWRGSSGALEDWKAAIETFTSQLWVSLMGPIHRRLVSLGLREGAPVTLIPQGGLGLLPLHAAWRRVNGTKRTFLDDYTVSYAPSAYALGVSRNRMIDERRHRQDLLAVVNPTGDLLFATKEGEAVAEAFPPEARHKLIRNEATSEAVLAEAPRHTYLHFACHGTYGWEEVMDSALVLAASYHFTLSEIISKLNLDVVRLVTLSACETGLTEFQRSPDEYIGLPAGFLQIGVPEVVSSLWAVDDLSTALLMARFYRFHLKKRLCTARALRAAQHWLHRDVKRPLVIEHVKSLLDELEQQRVQVPRWSEAQDSIERRLRRLQSQLRDLLKDERDDPGGRPFDHPYYWAAFTVWSPDTHTREVNLS